MFESQRDLVNEPSLVVKCPKAFDVNQNGRVLNDREQQEVQFVE